MSLANIHTPHPQALTDTLLIRDTLPISIPFGHLKKISKVTKSVTFAIAVAITKQNKTLKQRVW